MSGRRRYTVTVGDPADQARLERGARLLGKSMSGFFKTAALAYLDLVEKRPGSPLRFSTGAARRESA
jgi:hypothetical protein